MSFSQRSRADSDSHTAESRTTWTSPLMDCGPTCQILSKILLVVSSSSSFATYCLAPLLCRRTRSSRSSRIASSIIGFSSRTWTHASPVLSGTLRPGL